jgi:hypothetical protein
LGPVNLPLFQIGRVELADVDGKSLFMVGLLVETSQLEIARERLVDSAAAFGLDFPRDGYFTNSPSAKFDPKRHMTWADLIH